MSPEDRVSSVGVPPPAPVRRKSWPPANPTSVAARFHSILFPGPDRPSNAAPPDYFHDLNLDQIVAAITADWPEDELRPWFQTPLQSLDEITYRQDVMRDLDDDTRMAIIKAFLEGMRTARRYRARADDHCYHFERERWILDACNAYCACVENLATALGDTHLASAGLTTFRDYLGQYAESSPFRALSSEAKTLRSDFAAIRYELLIEGSRVTVQVYDGEADYSTAVEETFAKFRRDGIVKNYLLEFQSHARMHHIDAQALQCLARLLPEPFARLEAFCAAHADFFDDVVMRFDREIKYYVAYLGFAEKFRQAGLRFCYPQVSRSSHDVDGREAFDLALTSKLLSDGMPVVCNDFSLSGRERLLVVTGPNQGGKTTFARLFGQLHFLASVGCPVPGTEARLFYFDQLFTHFERQEDIANLRGKLQDDLVRIRQILTQATSDSIILMNEIFSSTSLKDAVYLSQKVMAHSAPTARICAGFRPKP